MWEHKCPRSVAWIKESKEELSDLWLLIHLAGVNKKDNSQAMLNGAMQDRYPDVSKDILRLIDKGYIECVSEMRSFDNYSAPQIKKWLASLGIYGKGSKQALIELALKSLTRDKIDEFLGVATVYRPTPKGFSYIRVLYELRSFGEWGAFASLKSGNFDQAISWLWETKDNMYPYKHILYKDAKRWYALSLDNLRKVYNICYDKQELSDSLTYAITQQIFHTLLFVGYPCPPVKHMTGWRELYFNGDSKLAARINLLTMERGLDAKDTIRHNNQYVYQAILDAKTCSQCAQLDRQIFDSTDSKVSVNTPPMHKGCRCYVTSESAFRDDVGRWTRDPITKEGDIIPYTTFFEWAETLDDKARS
jgi:hypothetical protein